MHVTDANMFQAGGFGGPAAALGVAAGSGGEVFHHELQKYLDHESFDKLRTSYTNYTNKEDQRLVVRRLPRFTQIITNAVRARYCQIMGVRFLSFPFL